MVEVTEGFTEGRLECIPKSELPEKVGKNVLGGGTSMSRLIGALGD